MNTLMLSADAAGVAQAAVLLRQGELVAIPTETVYGLAADALSDAAVRQIFAAKGRPQDNPLIVHIADWSQLLPLVTAIPETARPLADAYWPGPLTMIFPRSSLIPEAVSAGLPTVAVRFPSHPTAQAIIRAAQVPLAAPSANRSGIPSPTTAQHVMEDMRGRIAAVLDGGACTVGVESTVVDLTGDCPCVLRPGGVTVDMLRRVVGNVTVHPAVTAQLQAGQRAASPGMKYKHYAPQAHVTLVRGSADAFCRYVNRHAGDGVLAMAFDGETAALTLPFVTYGRRDDPAAQAREVFGILRQLDEKGAKQVYCACPSPEGVGLAVYNRLLRAAGFEVIDLD